MTVGQAVCNEAYLLSRNIKRLLDHHNRGKREILGYNPRKMWCMAVLPTILSHQELKGRCQLSYSLCYYFIDALNNELRQFLEILLIERVRNPSHQVVTVGNLWIHHRPDTHDVSVVRSMTYATIVVVPMSTAAPYTFSTGALAISRTWLRYMVTESS